VDFLISHRLLIFILGSFFFLKLSIKPLKNIRSHGFYRFFAFEGILGLVCLNLPFWFMYPFSSAHLVSWLLLIFSVFLVVHGLSLLRRNGGSGRQNSQIENFRFENTTQLVTSGIYYYIRHPMYSSLLFLAWGAFLKNISWPNTFVVLFSTGCLIATAKIEEHENCDYFGQAYTDYIKRSKMFVPIIF